MPSMSLVRGHSINLSNNALIIQNIIINEINEKKNKNIKGDKTKKLKK